VIVVPGWGFGETLQHAVRLSYGPLVHNLDKIEEAMQRIGTFLNRQHS
jgi:aspartate/methionine/tyrosine aminotransferase